MPTIEFTDTHILRQLAGDSCSHLKIIEDSVGVKCMLKGNTIELQGESFDVELVEHALKDLYQLIKDGFPLYPDDVWYAIRMLAKDRNVSLVDVFKDSIYISSTKKVIFPKSLQQKRYIDAMRYKDILFGIGPAGTGKTYLALAMGVHYFLKKKVERIILTRPAVEAGERLGFLPGDLQEKVNPYLRPLYDALYDMLERDHVLRLMARDHIEIAPLAFMRGRTLNDAFIILDEAQNTTPEQMKMFLTRLGFNSKAVITGDITQIDLPPDIRSGLVEASQILRDIEELGFVYFSEDDVVRHKVVAKIIKAYEKNGANSRPDGNGKNDRNGR
jgi:phosphate starvation-inducible PhoH-like protein